ncbi:hypothetical protein [Leptospira levettii]|uniref:hypothetical protein n=1 Tax=Leptospira levettii TaxID=2023178 RepID=UPI000F6362FF|nr:hypothetical protein [Leptospira levettii]
MLKPGAEYLSQIFRTGPSYEIVKEELGSGHREYLVKCNLIHIHSGKSIGSGAGSCSTLENRLRYKEQPDIVVLNEEIPEDYQKKKEEYKKQKLGTRKINGDWKWCKLNGTKKVEVKDIPETYNPCLKIAMDRAFVNTVITVFALSEFFEQRNNSYQSATQNESIPDPQATEEKPVLSKEALEDELSLFKMTLEEIKNSNGSFSEIVSKLQSEKNKFENQFDIFNKSGHKNIHDKGILYADGLIREIQHLLSVGGGFVSEGRN